MNWNPDEFLEQLYSEPRQLSFQATSQAEWVEWKASLKAELLKALVMPLRDAAPLEPVTVEVVDCKEYTRELIQLTTLPNLKMPAYLLLPKHRKGPFPTVLACPGHGYGSKELVGLLPDGSPRTEGPGIYKDYPVELAKRGFAVIVPELLGLGYRRLKQDEDKPPKENSCFRLSTNLLMAGRTLAGVRVHEMMRCIDYLQSRSEIAPDRIGCFGFSGGAWVSAMTAAVDERIRASVISGYTNTFRDSTMGKPHCVDNYIPELYRYAEMPEIIGLISPRPLLIESGEGDPGFPLHGAMKALEKLKVVYQTAKAEHNLEQDIHQGKHEVSGVKAYDWLAVQLGG